MAEISATLTTWAPRVRSILRIMTGLLLLQHGTMKYFNFPPSDYFAGGLDNLMKVAGGIELIGGVLIIIGLLTRPVAFICSGFTAAAYFMAHAPQSFYPVINQGELRGAVLLRVPVFRVRRPRPVVGRRARAARPERSRAIAPG